jgi:hypothetical protein
LCGTAKRAARDRDGSVASDRYGAGGRGMSASPPIASALWHRSEMTLRANRVITRRTKKHRYSIASSARRAGSAARREGFAERNVMECLRDDDDLFRLDVGGPDHLAPLLGFVGDKLAEIGGRVTQSNAAEVGKPRL